jgi:hypothetical protein
MRLGAASDAHALDLSIDRNQADIEHGSFSFDAALAPTRDVIDSSWVFCETRWEDLSRT